MYLVFNKKMTQALFFLFCLMTNIIHVKAQSISVIGNNWQVPIPDITIAGADYAGTYESAEDLFTLNGTLPNLLATDKVQVLVNFQPINWNNNLQIQIKRIGGRSLIGGICLLCSSQIVGGQNYTPLLSSSFLLFSIQTAGVLGIGNSLSFSEVKTQLKLSGVSVTLPADSYEGTVIFTISQ